MLVEEVVHFPEVALETNGFGGLSGRLGMGMDVRERHVAEDEPQFVAEGALKRSHDRVGRPAEGALVVAVLDKGDRRRLRSESVVVGAHRDG